MALVEAPPEIYDAFDARLSRQLWVADAPITPYPGVRALKLEKRALAAASAPKRATTLLLGYDKATYEEEQRILKAKLSALSAKLQPPPRKDVYVKGAMEWEKIAWKVWDKKKVQEEQRKDKYSTALTSYLGGQKLVHRFEPPAITQCAHCDLGGGLHPLRRCMGCMAVAYCCRMHQKVHWEWHKHICFAIRAANNLEAKRGEGAGYVKLRPRRWRRPPIENGAIVETNCRARWANWKQFYTNGAQSMLNQMGDGGPFVFKEWDEAVAGMAMCEEATFVFSVGATQRAMMPFVACRKAPPGTVLVVEVGLINVKRDGGRRQEVNDFLTAKFVAEKRQQKLDRLDEQKFMRLRMKQDRKDKADSVMKLLKANVSSETMEEQKDSTNDEVEEAASGGGGAGGAGGGFDLNRCSACSMDEPSSAAAAVSAKTAAPAPSPKPAATGSPEKLPASAVDEDVDVWEEEPSIDYGGFDEADDFFAQEGDGEAEPLNLPSAFDDDENPFDVSDHTAPGFGDKLPDTFDDGPIVGFKAVDQVEKQSKTQAPFLAAEAFDGAKAGYVFKMGPNGLGYYVDHAAARAPWEDYSSDPIAHGAIGQAPWDPNNTSTDPNAPPSSKPSLSAPPKKANDPWAMIDNVDTSDMRAKDQAAADKFTSDANQSAVLQAKKAAAQKLAQQQAERAKAPAPPAAAATIAKKAVGTMKALLDSLGLGTYYPAFDAAGLSDAAAVAGMHRNDSTNLTMKLTKCGLKMGQRQKVVLALADK